MKSFQKYFYLSIIFFLTLSACTKPDTCSEDSCPPGEVCTDNICVFNCHACGTFDGEASGYITIALTGTDTTFSNLPISLLINANPTLNAYNIAIDISSFLGATTGTLVPVVDGTLNDQIILIENQQYLYQGLPVISFNGTIEFDAGFNNLIGSLEISADVDADISFTALRQ